MAAWASTGLKGLDDVLSGLNKGDNVVWQVDSIEDYKRFVTPCNPNDENCAKRMEYDKRMLNNPMVSVLR